MKTIREFLADYWGILLPIGAIIIGFVAIYLDENGEGGQRRHQAWAECEAICGEHPVKSANPDSHQCVCDAKEIIRNRP